MKPLLIILMLGMCVGCGKSTKTEYIYARIDTIGHLQYFDSFAHYDNWTYNGIVQYYVFDTVRRKADTIYIHDTVYIKKYLSK
jgi:phage terminase large subunit